RESGRWDATALDDILLGTAAMLDRIAVAIECIPTGISVAMSLPTLPVPPLFHTPGWQAGAAEIELDQQVVAFGARLVRGKGVRVENSRRLAEDSPASTRFDLKTALLAGLPYTIPHADAVASALAQLLVPREPKKGLISDLDDTLWHGLVAEVGPDNVAWDLASHHKLHGLYQQLLCALSDQGVLVGIASKNKPADAERALQREHLLVPPGQLFPVEVHWGAKSGSVGRILQTWNIAAESVVFVDDSPMELAEVAAAHPGIECIQFPKE